jgi:anti-sigma regulatory factor (Ser/Thr protein kinase)
VILTLFDSVERAKMSGIAVSRDDQGLGCLLCLCSANSLSLDEVMANVVGHALEGRGEAATVDLELRLDVGVEPPVCEMMVVDDGPEFDPLSVPEPDRALGVEERPIGGLGMALVRRLMDEVQYERRDGKNRLRLQRRLVAMEA